MSRNLADVLIPFQSKVSIKNVHSVRNLQVYNNQQIFVTYDSMIHIHSINKIYSHLPSLLCILELQHIANRIEKNSYQDQLSQKIASSSRSKFGEIIFTEELNPDKNVLTSITHFRERIRFLGGEFVRVRSMYIHDLGHLLITFEDKRCILIRRSNLMDNYNNNHNLYNIQQPLLLNNILQSLVKQCIFASVHSMNELSLMCLHGPKKHNQGDMTISKIVINDINSIQIINISGKRPTLQEKGILQMSYIPNNNGCGWVALFYFNRVQILQFSEINSKMKTFAILSHKQADYKDELGDEQVVRMFKYQLPCKQQIKTLKVYLVASSFIEQLQINFKYEPKDSNSWTYFLKKKQRNICIKTDIYYVNYKGHYLQSLLSKDGYPHEQVNLAVETDNGVLIRLQAKNNNYKEGFLYLCCQDRVYMVEKMIKALQERQCGERNWVNFEDLNELQKNYFNKYQNEKYLNIRKEILKQIQNKYKSNKQQRIRKNTNIQNTILINVLLINVLTIFQGKKQPVEKLVNQTIKNQLNLNNNQSFDRTHCIISNECITTEDVMVCERCQLYSKKERTSLHCCYICWNPLLSIS